MIQSKKIAVLNETVAYYSENTLRRCIMDNGTCFYSGSKNELTESGGCAIGRLLSKELSNLLDNEFTFNKYKGNGGCGTKAIFKKLPLEIQDYGENFLRELQTLHDNNVFWRVNDLTIDGKKYVRDIKHKILIDLI